MKKQNYYTSMEATEMNKAIELYCDLLYGECDDVAAIEEAAWAEGPRVGTEALTDYETGRQVVVVDSHGIWFDCYDEHKRYRVTVKDPLDVAVFLRYGHA